MKTVFFIRHAKSSWADMSLRDVDRPLNNRGLRDAPFMAKMLVGRNEKADLIVSSPANRALTTAKYFAREQGIPDEEIKVDPMIYEAYPESVLQILNGLDDAHQTVFIFGHNPTFTTIANYFTREYIPNVPTCGIVKVESNISSWSEFSKYTGEVTAFYYPKQHFN